MVQLDGSINSTKDINDYSTINDRKEKIDLYMLFLVLLRAKATKLLLTP